jgi:hypothetical protein
MLERYQWLLLQNIVVVAAIGADGVCCKHTQCATNATNTVNVGVTKRRGYCYSSILGRSAASGNPAYQSFKVLIYLLFLLLVFYQQQVLGKWCCTNITSYGNNRYYLCCSLGNSTFFIGITAVALNGERRLTKL